MIQSIFLFQFVTINREDSLIYEMNIGGRDCNVRIEESF